MNGFYYANLLFVFKQLLNPYHNKTQAHFNASLRFIIFSLFTLYARSPCELNRSALARTVKPPPQGGNAPKKQVSFGPPPFGALLDEGVKNNMPVAYCLAREALRAEPERHSANGEAAPAGEKCNKKGRTNVLPFCGALPGTHPVAACRADFAHHMRSHRSAPLPSPLRFAASATGGAHLRGTN